MWFSKKKDKEDENTADAANADDVANEDKGSSTDAHHAIGDGSDGVPQELKDKLAEIRGDQDPDSLEVEVDDQGKAINPDEQALLDNGVDTKDGDTSSGDAVDQSGSEDSKSEAEADEDSDESNEDIELDSRLEEAGKALGWSEDKIRLVAETDISILEDIATRLESTETHRQDAKDGKEEGTEKLSGLVDEVALAELKEKLGDNGGEVLDAIVKGIEDKFTDKFKDMDDLKESSAKEEERRELVHKGQVADDVFDAHAKTFAEFGITKELKKDPKTGNLLKTPEFKVRSEVFKIAAMFHANNGGSFEKAMQEAVQHYAGGKSTSIATRQLVKDLNSNKKRFTPKPTGRKTVRVFKNPNAKKSHIVQNAMKRAGIDRT